MTNGKVSISLPPDLLRRAEQIGRRQGWSRSQTIRRAIEAWLRSLEEDRDVAAYIAGYLRLPEDAKEGEALLKAQMEGLTPEDWS